MDSMQHDYKVFVGVMHSGENELSRCLEILNQQTVRPHVELISGLANKEAHQKLYNQIMKERENFDFFIKCDADMVLNSEKSISEIIKTFEINPQINHLCLSVLDWFSNSRVIGLHSFRSGVVWPELNDGLFLDPNPSNAVSLYISEEAPSPIAYHACDPSPFQAFYFGVHRALKIKRSDELELNVKTSYDHLFILRKVFFNYLRTQDYRLGLVLLGAKLALETGIKTVEKKKEDYQHLFERYKALSPEEISKQVHAFYKDTYLFWVSRFVRVHGYKRISKSITLKLIQKMKLA